VSLTGALVNNPSLKMPVKLAEARAPAFVVKLAGPLKVTEVVLETLCITLPLKE